MNGPVSLAADPALSLDLHRRLCDGNDPIASRDFAVAFVPYLERHLAARFPSVDPQLLLTIAHDCVIKFVKHPQAFDPLRRLDLAGYLRMDAVGDARNALRSERRRQTRVRLVDMNSVEDGSPAGNVRVVEAAPPLKLVNDENARAAASVVAAVRAGLSQPERRVLDLMLDGRKETRAFAEALGLADQPEAEQARAVKRVKDRIKKRLLRAGGGRD